jgi:hypothetical protein
MAIDKLEVIEYKEEVDKRLVKQEAIIELLIKKGVISE